MAAIECILRNDDDAPRTFIADCGHAIDKHGTLDLALSRIVLDPATSESSAFTDEDDLISIAREIAEDPKVQSKILEYLDDETSRGSCIVMYDDLDDNHKPLYTVETPAKRGFQLKIYETSTVRAVIDKDWNNPKTAKLKTMYSVRKFGDKLEPLAQPERYFEGNETFRKASPIRQAYLYGVCKGWAFDTYTTLKPTHPLTPSDMSDDTLVCEYRDKNSDAVIQLAIDASTVRMDITDVKGDRYSLTSDDVNQLAFMRELLPNHIEAALYLSQRTKSFNGEHLDKGSDIENTPVEEKTKTVGQTLVTNPMNFRNPARRETLKLINNGYGD